MFGKNVEIQPFLKIEKQQVPVFIFSDVFNALKKFYFNGKTPSSGGVLIGKYQETGSPSLTIEGFLHGLYTHSDKDLFEQIKVNWENINYSLQKSYSHKQIVGWFYHQVGHQDELSAQEVFLHNSFFAHPWQIALIFKNEKELLVKQQIDGTLQNVGILLVSSPPG